MTGQMTEGPSHDGPGRGAERERFLTLLFALERLRVVESVGERSGLVEFHASYKYLLLAYDEEAMRSLGRVVATVAERDWAHSIQLYRAGFESALSRPARVDGHVNALMHMLGHITDFLDPADRTRILEEIDGFRTGRRPIDGAVDLIRDRATRCGVDYIARQYYFSPYPRSIGY